MGDVIEIAANLSTKGFEKGSKALTGAINSLSKSVKRILPSILGVGSAFAIITKAVSAFMQQNQQLSAKMSSVWTAFGNLLGPIIEKVIGWVTTAVSYLLSFLKLLGVTGKTASQLSKSAKGAGSDLKKTLAGFDELNTLQSNSGGGSGGATLDDIEPPDWMKNIAELIQGKQFEDAGRAIAAKLNEFIEGIDLAGFAQKISDTFKGILEFLIGFIDELDFHEVGKKIREFFLNIDWKGIIEDTIKLIGTILRGGIELLWGLLYEDDGSGQEPPFIKSLFGLVDSLENFCDVVVDAGEKLLQSLAPALEFLGDSVLPGVLDSLTAAVDNLSLLVQLLSGEISTEQFFDSLQNPIEGIEEALENLFTGIAEYVENIDWQKLGKEFIDFLGSLAEKAWDFLTEVDWEGLISSFFEMLGSLLGGIGGFIVGIFEEAIPAIGDWLVNAFNDIANMTWEGFLQGLLDALSGIWDWIKRNIIDPFVNAFKKAFGIHSPSTVMAEIGTYVIEGFFNGLTSIWNTITSWISSAAQTIVNLFCTVRDGIVTVFSQAWQSIQNGARSAWEGIKNVFRSVGQFFSDTFSKAWQGIVKIFSVAGEIFTDIKDGVKNAFVSIVNQLITGINKVVAIPFNGINAVLQAIHDVSILGVKPFTWVGQISVPQIPYLAKGGVLKKGQLGLLEGDGAEAVVPLEKNTEWINRVAEGMMDRLASGEYSLGAIGKNLAILNDIAERIYFKMPAVAGGAVLPYSVVSSSGDDSSSLDEAALTEAISELREAIDALMYALENMQWVAQFGNIRAIVQEITKVQRQMERSGGY